MAGQRQPASVISKPETSEETRAEKQQHDRAEASGVRREQPTRHGRRENTNGPKKRRRGIPRRSRWAGRDASRTLERGRSR